MITHYDLFAGIGGFSLALEEVFKDEPIRHVFCEWERFPTAVLKRHWPEGEYWGDIAELVTDTIHRGLEGRSQKTTGHVDERGGKWGDQKEDWTIVTGGFPCQPFSHAGRRKGTADDRYQWPNMFAVIKNVRPRWVVAENVRGLTTWNDGVVLETVCTDLESEGYETRAFIIPAVAVGAPHRRDRVWIIGHLSDPEHAGLNGAEDREGIDERNYGHASRQDEPQQSTRPDSLRQEDARTVANSRPQRREQGLSEGLQPTGKESERPNRQYPDWGRNWQDVARETSSTFVAKDYREGEENDDGKPVGRIVGEVPFATCDDAVDDGLPRLVDGVSYSRAKWRKDSLKAYGNGIVMQVAMQIMKGIKEAEYVI